MAAGLEGPAAIAVSGGSDSLALMRLADRWAKAAGRELLVLSVDHGLRPEAAGEADWVVRRARALGHAAKVLTWTPEGQGQAAARRGRHGLLARAAREAGAGLLLLGHTRDDAEETLLMRLSRPTGLAGASGPQPLSVSPVWPEGRGLMLGRPLIGTRRTDLQAWLRDEGETWVSDPSNEAVKYERVRLRALIAALPCPARLEMVCGDAALLRAHEDLQLAADVERIVRVEASGLVRLEGVPERLARSLRLLKLVLQAASGGDAPPDLAKVEALAAALAEGGPGARQTLGGAWIQRRGETVLVGRDPGEARTGWSDGVWDGRYARGEARPAPGEPPFLVRHSVPAEGGYREIIGERLRHWADCLRAGARVSAELQGEAARAALTRYPG